VQSEKAAPPVLVTGRYCMRGGIRTSCFEPVYLVIVIPFR
jgi:hypothetical protein